MFDGMIRYMTPGMKLTFKLRRGSETVELEIAIAAPLDGRFAIVVHRCDTPCINVERFALLVLHDTAGASVLEAEPPTR